MCSGDVDSDGEKPVLRSLTELRADFERRRPRPVLRSLKELSLDFAHRKRCAARPQAPRSLEELAADFQARPVAPAVAPRARGAGAASCQELSGRSAYGRDELLAVLACMQLGPLDGRGLGAGTRTIKLGAPPGLGPLGPGSEDQQEDPALDGEELPERLEAREAREAGADRHSAETFGPNAQVEDARVAEEDEAYLASLGLSCLTDEDGEAWGPSHLADDEAWALQPHLADEEALEEFWWNVAAMEQQCYAEDVWDFSESIVGYEDSFWGYPQETEGFHDGLLSSDTYFGLADKSSLLSMAKDPEAHLSSTAPSDEESGGEEAALPLALRQAICW